MDGALRLAVDGGELRAVLGLLRRLFDIRITFFDLEGSEADGFDIKPISAYCRTRRRDPAFAARCAACDRRQLEVAKRSRGAHIYRCHDALVEGIIPLYDRAGAYLGSIMFGQLRPPGPLPDGLSPAQAASRVRLPVAEPKRLRDLADLLKWLSEHLANAAVVRRAQQPWAETAARFVSDNLARPITTAGLARVLGRSPSFITHRFRLEFGMPLHRYVMRARLAAARERLSQGASVRELASELGFCDEFHLSRAFRAHWGKPPSAFKPT